MPKVSATPTAPGDQQVSFTLNHPDGNVTVTGSHPILEAIIKALIPLLPLIISSLTGTDAPAPQPPQPPAAS